MEVFHAVQFLQHGLFKFFSAWSGVRVSAFREAVAYARMIGASGMESPAHAQALVAFSMESNAVVHPPDSLLSATVLF